jgi:hypothetical protein
MLLGMPKGEYGFRESRFGRTLVSFHRPRRVTANRVLPSPNLRYRDRAQRTLSPKNLIAFVVKYMRSGSNRIGAAFHQHDVSSTMRVGQTAYVPVYANKLWNDSGVDVVSGQVFNFAVPAGEEWTDWRNRCNADGYNSTDLIRRLEIFRRVPKARWLQLIGTIGKSIRSAIVIGSNYLEFLPPSPGRLYLFANDLPWMYWNNRGMIAVRITRTK